MDQEIIDYIFRFYSHLFTEKEQEAYHHHENAKHIDETNKSRIAFLKQKKLISTDPEVLELLKDGETAFKKRTAERVLRDTYYQVFINKCKRCGKLTRTPKARQCRYCNHRWFERMSEQS